MSSHNSRYSSLNFNILYRLALVGIIACSLVAYILYEGFKTDALENIKQHANEQIQRTAQMFMVSTIKFNDEFTQEQDAEKRAIVHQNWIKTIEAVDTAVTHDFGEKISRIRLFTDESSLNLNSFGKSITAMKGDFERQSIQQFSQNKLEAITQLDEHYYKISIPLMSNMHDGCANCHSMPTSQARVLGGLSVVTNIEEKMNHASEWAFKMSGIVFIILTVVIAIVYYFLYKNVSQPIANLTKSTQYMAKKLAQGKLGQWRSTEAKYEIGVLASGVESLHSTLHSVLQDINVRALEVDEHAQITSTIAEQAQQNLSGQQTNISDISLAINELKEASGEVSQRAQVTTNTTQLMSQGMTDSYQKMQDTLSAIRMLSDNVDEANDVVEHLSQRSESIGSIVSTIDGIAEQTNLLALNAAIEAARAGEQGRGFAVVADEVRTLAQRTQTATSEINQLVSALQTGSQQASQVMRTSSEKAADTVNSAMQASENLQQVSEQITTINELNSDIAVAAEQQSATVAVLGDNISGISDASAEILQGAEQTVQETQQLGEISHKLGSLIKVE